MVLGMLHFGDRSQTHLQILHETLADAKQQEKVIRCDVTDFERLQ
jgi:hypothetical protein